MHSIIMPWRPRFASRPVACLTLLVASLVASPLRGQGPHPTLAALPDGQWSVLPDSAMTSAGSMRIPCCDFTIGCALPGIFAFSGATLDGTRRQIVVWGGGHNDYFGNQLVAFDLATLRWRALTAPTSVCLFDDPPTYRYTNGLPVSRHTYDHIDVIDHLGVFFAYSGATADAPPFNNGTSYGDLWTFDFDQAAWTDRTLLQGGDVDYFLPSPGASGEYDPVSGDWVHISQHGTWRLDFDTHRWSLVDKDGHPGIERTSVLDPTRRLIWTYGGEYGGEDNLSAFDLETDTFSIVSSDNLPGATSAAGLTYDAANDQLVLFGGTAGRAVYNYDIDGGTWTAYAYGTGPAPDLRTYSRFLYDAVNNVFFLIDSVDQVWVWKNTLGSDVLVFADGFERGNTNAWSATASP